MTNQVQQERDRCVALCRRRAELWRKTAAAQSSIPPARLEAQARANEAAYLADLIEHGEGPGCALEEVPDA